jgi:hypothetical protein
MFDGVGRGILLALIVLPVSLALAVWKLIDIIVWVSNHVSVSVN